MIILLFLVSFFIIRKVVIKYFSSHWNDGLSAKVYFETDFINEGEKGHVCEELINDKKLPLPVVNVKFELDKSIRYAELKNTIVSDKQYRSDTLSLGSHKKVLRRFEVTYTKRGVYSIDTIELNTIDPISDYKRLESFTSKSSIYVYPAYSRYREILAPFSRVMGEALKNRFVFEDPFEFKGIRDYTASDPMKKINWSASARTGELKVNNYYDTTSRQVTIFLDISNDSVWKRYDQMEESIRITRNLMEEFIRNQIPVNIITNGRDCFNGDLIVMESGVGAGVVTANLKNLTVIDLDCKTGHMSEYFLENESGTDELSILLSADISPGLATAYEKYLGRNTGEWIAPVISSKECNIHSSKINITYVEVNRL
ncbi:MAG: DUF58 domain-containing protein [Butyrivibrio sp.]